MTVALSSSLLGSQSTLHAQTLASVDSSIPKARCSPSTHEVFIAVHLSPRSARVRAPKVKGVKLQDDMRWLTAQLNEANRLFAKLDLCFVMREASRISKRDGVMKTRAQRTSLGSQSGRLTWGQIDLFIVNRLEDVDVADAEIRGVHWRDPKDRDRRRWIILSRIARPKVLAHELGHYFDLPHSRYPASIMNKTPRAKPPMSARGFVKAEYQKMRSAWERMRRTGQLAPRSKQR